MIRNNFRNIVRDGKQQGNTFLAVILIDVNDCEYSNDLLLPQNTSVSVNGLKSRKKILSTTTMHTKTSDGVLLTDEKSTKI
jgi:hypothetical protein